jgi:hypothetical protein
MEKMKAVMVKEVAENAPKKMARRRDAQKAALVQKTAKLTGKSERYVRAVMDGSRNNDEVELVYLELQNGDGKLLEAVKALVPFTG